MGPRLGRVEYRDHASGENGRGLRRFNGATLRTRGILRQPGKIACRRPGFNGATLRTRGIRYTAAEYGETGAASMGPRLGRVEYACVGFFVCRCGPGASMGPRLGRVEYASGLFDKANSGDGFNGATLRTRGIP